MYAIEVRAVFSAAHALRLPGGGIEPVHGHDFHVTARLACAALDALETVIDFHQVERALEGIVGPWRNQHLNQIAPFARDVNPSAERIAETIGRALLPAVIAAEGGRVRLAEVRVTEAPGCLAVWSPD